MRRAALAIVGTAAATTLLVGLKAQAGSSEGAEVAQEVPADAGSAAPPASGSASAPAGGGKPAGSTPAAPPAQAAARKITGDSVQTPYGAVQVTITVTGNKITDVTAKIPNTGDSAPIAANAGPKLKQQALAKQTADLDTVSGATYTSEGYMESLQSALDKR